MLRPEVNNQEIPDIQWVIGFSEGESGFFSVLQEDGRSIFLYGIIFVSLPVTRETSNWND